MTGTGAFDCTIPVGWQRYTGTEQDELGNEIETWADPEEVLVFGWEPPKSTEPALAGHDRVVVDVLLYAPASTKSSPHDRVVLGGGTFEVIGDPQDPNFNPWWQPGLATVNLRRVEG